MLKIKTITSALFIMLTMTIQPIWSQSMMTQFTGVICKQSDSVNNRFEFEIFPGATPDEIRFTFSEANISLTPQGKIEIHSEGQKSYADVPYAYQESPNGDRIPVKINYKIEGEEISFSIGDYELAQPVLIGFASNIQPEMVQDDAEELNLVMPLRTRQ